MYISRIRNIAPEAANAAAKRLAIAYINLWILPLLTARITA